MLKLRQLTRWAAVLGSVAMVLLVGVSTAAAATPSAALRPTAIAPAVGSWTVDSRVPNLRALFRNLLGRAKAYGRKQLATPLEVRYVRSQLRRWARQQLVNWYCYQWVEYYGRRYSWTYAIDWWVYWTDYDSAAFWSYWYCRNNNYPPLN